MPPLPPCSSDTYSKIAELEAQSATLANNYKKSLNCDHTAKTAIAYLDENRVLRPWGTNYRADLNETGTCRDNLVHITTEEWNSLPLGQEMSKKSFCGIANVDILDKKELVKMSETLLDTATEIYNKIKNMEKENHIYGEQYGKENKKLNTHIHSYKYLYEELQKLQAMPDSSLGAQLTDSRLLVKANYYQYIMWALFASILISYTIHYIRRS